MARNKEFSEQWNYPKNMESADVLTPAYARVAKEIHALLVKCLSDEYEVILAPWQLPWRDIALVTVINKDQSPVISVFHPDADGGWDILIYNDNGETLEQLIGYNNADVMNTCASKYGLNIQYVA